MNHKSFHPVESALTRVPDIDWNEGFERHWFDGNPVVTHAFNALSLFFPQAERFFIETAREMTRDTALKFEPALTQAVQHFVTQEATHTVQHKKYNAILAQQGFLNVAHDAADKRQGLYKKHFSPLTKLAIVCGYEHFTAILGHFALSNPDLLKTAAPKMALIWGWHAAEETEHKAVCFDLYNAASGGWLRRGLAFVLASVDFFSLFGLNYFHLLRRDGCLGVRQLPKSILQFSRFFFGRRGVAWPLIGYGVRYLSPWFHPWHLNNQDKLQTWLTSNQHLLYLGTKN